MIKRIHEIDMYCSECEEVTRHELYDYTDSAEMWDCTVCGNHEIIRK